MSVEPIFWVDEDVADEISHGDQPRKQDPNATPLRRRRVIDVERAFERRVVEFVGWFVAFGVLAAALPAAEITP